MALIDVSFTSRLRSWFVLVCFYNLADSTAQSRPLVVRFKCQLIQADIIFWFIFFVYYCISVFSSSHNTSTLIRLAYVSLLAADQMRYYLFYIPALTRIPCYSSQMERKYLILLVLRTFHFWHSHPDLLSPTI